MNVYRRAFTQAESFYTRRVVRYHEGEKNEKYRLATVLFFVCFTDDGRVDYGIGYATYEFSREKADPVFQLI